MSEDKYLAILDEAPEYALAKPAEGTYDDLLDGISAGAPAIWYIIILKFILIIFNTNSYKTSPIRTTRPMSRKLRTAGPLMVFVPTLRSKTP